MRARLRVLCVAGLGSLTAGIALAQTGAETPVPIPESRPAAEVEKARPETAPETTPVPEPSPADEPAPKAPEPKPETKPEPEAVKPAYVPPEKARTTPEPSAPETPAANVTPAESVAAAEALLDAEQCEAELRRRGVKFAIRDSVADGECGVLRPVAVEALSSGVTVTPETLFLCRTALALDIWVADSVVAALKKAMPSEKLVEIGQASTFVCRARASEQRISEHSRGSAIDIASFNLESGTRIEVSGKKAASPEDRFLADIRKSACGPFRTVLGPGTDADHETHFHFDIAARRNDSTYCR